MRTVITLCTPPLLAMTIWLAILGVGAAAPAPDIDHRAWDGIVKQYVDDDGHVAYRRLKAEGEDAFARYLETLATAKVDELPTNAQLAFWINAYNGLIVAGILDGYSAENALKRYSLFKTYTRVIAGERRTPDDIEHSVIRARFQDARTHFTVVCASSSCPKLRREAYVGARLGAQLDDQGRRFMNDPSRNRIDPATGTVALSQIFKWFHEDFTRDGKTLAEVLGSYLTADQVRLLRDKAPTYLDYDWTMNAQPGQRP